MKKQLRFIKSCLTALAILLPGAHGISAQCAADYTYTLGAGGTATFASTSTGTTSGTTYQWYLPNNATTPVTTYTFDTNDIFTVNLSIYDTTAGAPCSSVISHTIGIGSAPCNDSIYFISSVTPSGLVQFLNFNYGYTLSWDFGDGTTGGNSHTINHTYTTTGVYNPTLTAVSYSGTCTFTATETVSITSITPCSVTAGYTYTMGSNYVFFSSTSTGANNASSYTWYFNDGSPLATGDTISHAFPVNGTYTVMHTVYGGANNNPLFCSDSIAQVVVISNVACNAMSSFALLKDSTQALNWHIFPGYPVNVSAAQWSWGDGSTSTGLYPSHTYSAAGMYNICLSVTVSCGATYSVCSLSSIYRVGNTNQMVSVSVVDPLTVGIKTNKQLSGHISIAPNPANGSFALNMDGIHANTLFDVSIVNLLGETIYSEKINSESSTFSRNISVSRLAAGTYFVKVASDAGMQTTKLIVNQ